MESSIVYLKTIIDQVEKGGPGQSEERNRKWAIAALRSIADWWENHDEDFKRGQSE